MKTLRVPTELKPLGKIYQEAGYKAYLIGGAVRDMLLDRPVTDYDLGTDAPPEVTRSVFRRTIPTGIEHGTLTVLFKGKSYEVTTFRTESGYSDSRHPDEVVFTSSIEEDLSRRDFTINALALNLINGEMVDTTGGLADLQKGRIRAIGEASERFAEDALRVLRAARFSAQLSFDVDEATRSAMAELAPKVGLVSAERLRDELGKLLLSKAPARGLLLMRDTGLLAVILPELDRCAGVKQGPIHSFDVLTHSIYACEGAPPDRLELRLAALLHDIGKPETRTEDANGSLSFHRHEERSAALAEQLLRRLRFSNQMIKHVVHLTRHHMFNYTEEWSDAAVRRFLHRVGSEYVEDLLALRIADIYGMRRRLPKGAGVDRLRERIGRIQERKNALSLADLAVDGNELQEAGIPRGPAIGSTLRFLLETVLEDPELNERDTLIEIATRFYHERLSPLQEDGNVSEK